MLLNYDNVLHLKTYNDKLPYINNDTSYSLEKNTSNVGYWLIQFSDSTSFKIHPIDTVVPANIIDRIKNKEVYLVLDNAYEYFYDIVDSVYEDVILKYNLPAEQIIIVSGNYDLLNYMIQYTHQHNLQHCKIEFFNYWQKHTLDSYLNSSQDFLLTLEKQHWEYEKKFLSLNRRWRPHRLMLLTLLWDNVLLHKGHVSFKLGTDNGTWEENIEHAKYHYRKYTDLIDLIDKHDYGLKRAVPLNLDPTELDPFEDHKMLFYPGINKFYEDTYFSVVTESTSDRFNQGRFLTEKIFKPIALRHPFIVWGADKTLEALRLLGYKTFEGIIDESYDNESNEITRANMIVNEIERLSNLTGLELENFLTKAREICFYNYVIFRNRDMTKFEYVHRMNY